MIGVLCRYKASSSQASQGGTPPAFTKRSVGLLYAKEGDRTLIEVNSYTAPVLLAFKSDNLLSSVHYKAETGIHHVRISRNNVRNMRTSLLLDALVPVVRAKILAAIVGRAEKKWYLTAFLQTSPSSLQREFDTLSKAGILEQ